jgi:hypothetical protein
MPIRLSPLRAGQVLQKLYGHHYRNLTTTTSVTEIIPKYKNINKYNLKGGQFGDLGEKTAGSGVGSVALFR